MGSRSLGRTWGWPHSTVNRFLKQLIKEGWISKTVDHEVVRGAVRGAITLSICKHKTSGVIEKGARSVGRSVDESASEAVFAAWINAPGTIKHKALTPAMKAAISTRVKDGYTPARIISAIARYGVLIGEDAAPGYGQWSLKEFLTRDAGGYIDKLNDPKFQGYRNNGSKRTESLPTFTLAKAKEMMRAR